MRTPRIDPPLHLLVGIAVLAAVGAAGCTTASGRATWHPISNSTGPTDASEAQRLWDRREDEASLRKAIAFYEDTFRKNPSAQMSERLARAYFVLAEYFAETDDRAREQLHRSGMACALIGMRCHYELRQALDRDRTLTEAVALVDKEHLGPLFWYTAHLGRWLCLQSIWTRWKHRGLIDALFAAIRRLDALCYHGSFYGMLGSYYARLGDMKQSAACFEKAIKIAPFALGARRLYAIEYAVPTRNKDLFVKQLTAALEQPEPDIPDVIPEFRLEQRLARKLLARVGEYFPE